MDREGCTCASERLRSVRVSTRAARALLQPTLPACASARPALHSPAPPPPHVAAVSATLGHGDGKRERKATVPHRESRATRSPLPRPHPRCAALALCPLPSSTRLTLSGGGATISRAAGRLDQFEGGKFPNITDVLFEHRSDDEAHIQLEYWSSPGREKARCLFPSSAPLRGSSVCAKNRLPSRRRSASTSSPRTRGSNLARPGPSASVLPFIWPSFSSSPCSSCHTQPLVPRDDPPPGRMEGRRAHPARV